MFIKSSVKWAKWGGEKMERIVNSVIAYLDANGEWSELEKMKMRLGFQVLFHNVWMVAVILIVGGFMGVLKEAVVLFLAFGLLKINMGGLHFQTSLACLLSTGTFVIGGSFLSRHMEIPFWIVAGLYVVCIVVFAVLGPQGTKNNPLSEESYQKARRNSMVLSIGYFVITVISYVMLEKIPYLLLIAIVFEVVTLLPYKKTSRI